MLVRTLPLFLLACATPETEAPTKLAAGAIEGRVCSPENRVWANGAIVTARALDGGEDLVTNTDAEGRYTFADVPGDAEYTVSVQIGGELVSTEILWVPAGETVALEPDACLDAFTEDVLVITGPSSEASSALVNAGITTSITTIDGGDTAAVSAVLDDGSALGAYGLVVFEGGFAEDGVVYDLADPTDTAVAARMQNLRDYVAAGGSVVATDVAYDVVEIGWPDATDFVGEDGTPDGAEMGEVSYVNAVPDEPLAAFLGASSVPVVYGSPEWPAVLVVDDDVTVLLHGNVTYENGFSVFPLSRSPLLHRFAAGAGTVTFSTFHLSATASAELVETLRYTLHTP